MISYILHTIAHRVQACCWVEVE